MCNLRNSKSNTTNWQILSIEDQEVSNILDDNIANEAIIAEIQTLAEIIKNKEENVSYSQITLPYSY